MFPSMSRRASTPAIGVELAEWMVGAPLTPEEKAEIQHLSLIQRRAAQAKERVVARAQVRVAMEKLKLN